MDKAGCRAITKRLMAHRFGEYFRDPVDTSDPELRNYTRIVKKPMDLSTILKTLDANGYKSVEEWEADVRLVCDNCILYNRRDAYISDVAEYMKEVFDKYLVKLRARSYDRWLELVEDLYVKLHNQMKWTPQALSKIASKDEFGLTLSKQQYTELANSFGKVTDKGEITDICQLLRLCDVPLPLKASEAIINLHSIPESAVIMLWDYAQERGKI